MLERDRSTELHRPHRTRLAARLAAVDWLRWELGSVVAFHGLFAAVIAFAPRTLVVTPATWPMFAYLHRPGMAAFFFAVTIAGAACWVRPTAVRQMATWLGVYMLGAGWITGFIFAIGDGRGGLYGVVVWAVLLALWTSTAVRLGLRSEA